MKRIIILSIMILLTFTAVNAEYKAFYAQGNAKRKIISLSFDDGPGPHTEAILAILARYGIRSTFFMAGELVKIRPEIVKKVYSQGHEIGSHTWSHKNYYTEVKIDKEAVLFREITKTDDAINSIIGSKPRLLRMPNGYSKQWARDVSTQTGHIMINWSFGTDWKKLASDKLAEAYIANIAPGAIMLMHDGGSKKEALLKALPAIIEAIRAKGYEIVPVGELLGIAEVYQKKKIRAEGEN